MQAAETTPTRVPNPKPALINWVSVAWFGGLLLISYYSILAALAQQWSYDEDVSHGFFVPPVAAYIAWQKRQEIWGIEWKPNYYGALVVLWGGIQLLIGSLGAELFLQRTSLIIMLVGSILLLGGTRVLRAAGFPLVLLLFMVPIPKVVYGHITLPLQLFASQVAEQVLSLLDIPVMREGNIIELANKKLNVVEACSGIRSLMSLSFLALIYAYFFDDKPWMRWALLAGTVPIAIAANAGRVSLTGIITQYNPELAEGVFHSLEGWLIFAVDVGLLIAYHQLLNWVWARRGKRAEAQA